MGLDHPFEHILVDIAVAPDPTVVSWTNPRPTDVRLVLGAGRGRPVRQLLTDSVALSLVGGVPGLAAAAIVLRVVPALVPVDVARLDEVRIDEVTVAFTIGRSVVVGLLSGVISALQWSRLHLTRTLNERSAQSAGWFPAVAVEPVARRAR